MQLRCSPFESLPIELILAIYMYALPPSVLTFSPIGSSNAIFRTGSSVAQSSPILAAYLLKYIRGARRNHELFIAEKKRELRENAHIWKAGEGFYVRTVPGFEAWIHLLERAKERLCVFEGSLARLINHKGLDLAEKLRAFDKEARALYLV